MAIWIVLLLSLTHHKALRYCTQGITEFYLTPTRASTSGMNLPLLPSRRASPHLGRYSFPVPLRAGGWVGLGGWLHTKVVCNHFDRPKTVTHPTTNWAWHRVTSLMHPMPLLLCHTATTKLLSVTSKYICLIFPQCTVNGFSNFNFTSDINCLLDYL